MDENSIKKSITTNNNLWIALWILGVMNVLALMSISRGFVFSEIVLSVLVGIIGIVIIKRIAKWPSHREGEVEEINEDVIELMKEVKPLCETVYNREIERITEPVIEGIRQDVARNLMWLWEEGQKYLLQVDDGINETRALMQMVDSLDNGKLQNVQKLQENLDFLERFVTNMDTAREKDEDDLEQCVINKATELKQSMVKEKEIFYDYIEKMLSEQMKHNNEPIEISDYVDIHKLGEQFAVVIEKSIIARLPYFENSIIADLENISADIVGRMQKGAMQIMNIFKDIEEFLNRMIEEYSSDNVTGTRRLEDSRQRIIYLKDKANETMVTLAWQDILLEKRWQDTQEKLFLIKERVMQNVGDDVVEFLQSNLEEKIADVNSLRDNSENVVIYKAILDAEIIYQVYVGDNLLDIIGDGINALLQFLRPVELLVSSIIRFNEAGVNKRRLIRDQIKRAEHQEEWEKTLELIEYEKPELLPYLDDIFPRTFYSFCNSPYIKQKPENLNQAAWMIFMVLIDDEMAPDELRLLVGLLLYMHSMRNHYVHPLKNTPLPLKDDNEVDYMRYACYRGIELLLALELNGMVRTRHK